MQTVKVRLRKPTRVFTFLSDNIAIDRNEDCIVRSDRGLEYGTCIVPPEECPEETRNRYKMTLVRKVTHNDESTYHQILIEENRAKELCADRIRLHNLPMKLVDVEYTFDKHKVIFYFTSMDRVDFRHLVRDLAQDLKMRIELRHIQVRDEAKIIGGIGMCGRELCCSTWLHEFKPISMKMAKRQNLSLNPSKISGQCGRLLCCLSYENELYKEAKRSDIAARSAKEEPEPIIEDGFGHDAAFADMGYFSKPADWEDRLREVADVDDADIEQLKALEDERPLPSAVVELGDVEDRPARGPQQRHQQQRPQQHGNPRHQGQQRPPQSRQGQGRQDQPRPDQRRDQPRPDQRRDRTRPDQRDQRDQRDHRHDRPRPDQQRPEQPRQEQPRHDQPRHDQERPQEQQAGQQGQPQRPHEDRGPGGPQGRRRRRRRGGGGGGGPQGGSPPQQSGRN